MRGKVCEIKAAEPKESSNNYHARGRRGSGNNSNNKGYRSYPPQGVGYPTNGDAYPSQGYPSTPEIPGQVNQGVPSTLPMSNGHHPAMYSPYGMGAAYYHHPSCAMPAAAYPPYVGYPPEGAFYEQGNNMAAGMDAYPSAMTATPPGPHSQQSNEAYEYVGASYGNGFVPVEYNQSARQEEVEPPQGTSSNGETGNQT